MQAFSDIFWHKNDVFSHILNYSLQLYFFKRLFISTIQINQQHAHKSQKQKPKK